MQVQSNTPKHQAIRLQDSRFNSAKANTDKGSSEGSASAAADGSSDHSELLTQISKTALQKFHYQLAQQQSNDQDDPEALLRTQLGAIAQNKDEFHATMQQVYGANYNVAEAENLRQQALNGNFDWMPNVRYVESDVLGGANGAYDAESQTVLLNADLKGSELAAETFVEEAGHHLDTLLNDNDTAGDEGEMFRRVLSGEELSEAQIEEIQNEDDTGTIIIDGKETQVEFWSLKKAWRKHVQKPFKKHVSEPFKKHVVKPLTGLAKDAVAIGKDLLKFSIELPGQIMMGAGRVTMGLFKGGLKGGWNALRTEVNNVSSFIGKQVVDTFMMGLHSVVNVVEGVLGTMDERKLTSEEIASLQLVYGDTIDYSEVRIQTGGIKDSIGMTANVVGNDIFMPDKYLDGNGGFTQEGQDILIHEMGHIWQYQNQGPEYISEALQTQNNDGDGSIGTGEGYDWLAAAELGVPFSDMNPESQAELAMFIGLSIPDNATEIDRTTLEAILRNRLGDQGYTLSDDVFNIAVEAHNILRGTPQPVVVPAPVTPDVPDFLDPIADTP